MATKIKKNNRFFKSTKSLGKTGNKLIDMLMRTAMAVGFVMAPWAMEEAKAEIVRDGGGQTYNDLVNHIYAGKVNGDNAVNRFSKFNLDAGKIANMYFRENATSADAKNLFNFVNDKINIAGTVNAIKGNKIGGNMYFLSPNGMVVSSTGVINAGSINLIAGGAYPSADDAMGVAGKVIDGTYTLDNNKKSSIEIAGSLNATNSIVVKGNKELIVKGTAKLNTASNTTVDDKVAFDFSSLVNIKDSNGNVVVNSGLGQDLVLERDNGNKGNIVLNVATRNYNESANEDFAKVLTDNNMVAKISMENGAVITSDGDVSIGAHTYNDSSFGNLASWGNVAQTGSSVAVNGTINANTISINATTQNNFIQGFFNKAAKTLEQLGGRVAQNSLLEGGELASIQVDVISLKANSRVVIGDNARLTATGTDVLKDDGSVKTAVLSITSSSSIKIDNESDTNNSSSGNNKALATGALYTYVENDAELEIANGARLVTTKTDGNMGSISANATATTTLNAGAGVDNDNTSDKKGSKWNAAVQVSRGKTNSKVSLGTASGATGYKDGDNYTLNATKNISVSANTTISTNNVANVRSNQNTKVSTAILYYDMDSTAVVDVNTHAKAANDLAINATNTDKISTKANNAVTPTGQGTYIGILADPSSNYDGFANKIVNIIRGKAVAETKDIPASSFELGGSINFTKTSNKAVVNVGKLTDSSGTDVAGVVNIADLQSNHDLTIAATQTYTDYRLLANGASSATNEKNVNIAIAYGTMDDVAQVNVISGNSTNFTNLTAGNNLSVTADSEYVWARTEAMKNAIVGQINKIILKDIRTKLGAASHENVIKAIENVQNNPTDANIEGLSNALNQDPGAADWISALLDAGFAIGKLWRNCFAYANAASYTNINVGSSARTSSTSIDSMAVAISGAYTNFKHNANVVIGTNAKLNANNDIKLEAKAKQIDVNYYGVTQGILGNFSKEMGISKGTSDLLKKLEIDAKVLPGWSKAGGSVYGGNLGITNNTLTSNVVVAEGAQLTAKNIQANSDTDLQRVLVTLGGGEAGTSGATGMLSTNLGTTNSIVSIDDEAIVTATGNDKGVSLNADNDALIIDVQGDVTVSGGSAAVGIGFGLSNYNFNTVAAVKDNDREKVNATYSGTDKDSLAEAAYYNALKLALNDTQKGYLGSSSTSIKGAITTTGLNINATASPTIWNISVAGGVSGKSNSHQAGGNNNQAGGNAGNNDQNVDHPNDIMDDDDIFGNLFDLPEEAEEPQAPISNAKITIAGALAINRLTGVTSALLENAKVNLTGSKRSVDVYAYDDAMSVALAGALSLKTSTASASAFSGMMSGTSAVNIVNMTALSQVKKSTITDALSITNEAKQAEKLVATAAPVAVDASSTTGKGFSLALNASVNKVDNAVHANLINNTVDMSSSSSANKTRVQNIAYDKSTLITGGVDLDVAKASVGIGVNGVYARLNNDIAANAIGGTYNKISSFENAAASNQTQLNVAIGIGVGSGDSSTLTGGAVWSNVSLDNDVTAKLSDIIISSEAVKNEAIDGDIDDGKAENDTWITETTASGTNTCTKNQLLGNWGVDIQGEKIKAAVSDKKLLQETDTAQIDSNVEAAKEYAGGTLAKASSAATYTNKKITFAADKETLIINGAMQVEKADTRNDISFGAAIADNIIDNDYTAAINNADIRLSKNESTTEASKSVQNIAESNSQIVAVAMGVSASTGGNGRFNAAGSGAANSLYNDTKSEIINSTIDAKEVKVEADSKTTSVAVAGSLLFNSQKVGLGLAVAVNDANNTVLAQVLGSDLNTRAASTIAVNVNGLNTSKLYAVAAGLAFDASTTALAATGNVAVNSGYNDTKAIIDKKGSKKTIVKNASSINATAGNARGSGDNEDVGREVAVALGANIGGSKASVGVGFAVNKLTDETMEASINNARITTTSNGMVNAVTNDKAALTAMAFGAGLSAGTNSKYGIEGAAAITLADNKKNIARLVDTEINKDNTADISTFNSVVNVKANENNKIISNADSISVKLGEGSASVGVGASAVRLSTETSATIANSTIKAGDILTRAQAVQKIYNVGVGIGGSKSTINGAGSLSVNLLKDDVKAVVENSTLTAKNNIGVLAQGEDTIVNVTGALSLGLGTNIGVGLAVAYNDLSGDITSTVSNSNLVALGQGTGVLTSHEFTTEADTASAEGTNKMTLTTNNHKGLVIDAYGKHDTTDVVISAGIAYKFGTEGCALGLEGLGSSTNLSGKTGAYLNNTDVNKDYTAGSGVGDAVVTATDQNITHDVNVNISVAGADKGAVSGGIAVSMAQLDRTIEAKATGTSNTNRKDVNADKLIVLAGGKNDGHMVSVGVDGALSTKAGLSAGALADCYESNNTINATLSNINSINNGTVLKAAHDNSLTYTGVGVVIGAAIDPSLGLGAGLGVAVGSVIENNTITGTVENTDIKHKKENAEDEFAVTNYSYSAPSLVAVTMGAGLAGAGVGVSVDNHTLNDSLALYVQNAKVGATDKAAVKADMRVKNYYEIKKDAVNVTLAGALAGATVAVNVQPTTINSAEVLNVTGSQIKANTIELENKEYRKIHNDTVTVSGATVAGIGVTRSYVAMGGQLMTTYQTQHNGEKDSDFSDDLSTTVSGANQAVSNAKKKIQDGVKNTLAKVEDGLQKATEAEQKDTFVEAVKGTGANDHKVTLGNVKSTSSQALEGLKLAASNNTINANSLIIKSTVKDDIDIYSGTGSVGILGINVNAARVDEHIKNSIEICGGTLNVGTMSVLGNVTGSSYVHAAIGTVGGATINVAYADLYVDSTLKDAEDKDVKTEGNSISVDGTTLNISNSLLVRAKEDATYKTYVNGGGLSIVGGGYVEAEAMEAIDNSVTIKNSTLNNTAALTDKAKADTNSSDAGVAAASQGALEIVAMKSNYVEAKTLYGAVEGVGGLSNSSTASTKGKSDIIFTDNTVNDKTTNKKDGIVIGNQVGVLDLYALYNAHAKVDMTHGSGSIVGGGGVYGHAKAEGEAVISASGNTFDVVNISALSSIKDNRNAATGGYNLAEANTQSINIAVDMGVGVNRSDATIETISKTDFTNNTYKYDTVNTPVDIIEYQAVTKDGVTTYEPVYRYEQTKKGKINLTVEAETDAKAKADIFGVSVGGGCAVGHNSGTITVNEQTLSNVGNSSDTYLKSLNLHTRGTNAVDNSVDGRGGGIISISPYAVTATNDLEVINTASLKGTYNVLGLADITATQKDEIEIQGSTASGGVIEVAGGTVTNTRKDTSATTVQLTDAQLTAESVNLSATNNMQLNKGYEFAMKGGSGGAIACASPTDFTNKLHEEANVKLTSSTVTSTEQIILNANTLNDVYAKSKFASGGALAGSNQASVDNTFTYSDNILVDANSKVKATSSKGDIVVTAVDDTNLQVGSYAYAYGSVLAIALPETNNDTTRTNSIAIEGSLASANNLKLYAGQYASVANAGLSAVVDVQSYAGAIIPGWRNDITNKITENNLVTIANGAGVTSIADIDIYANEGVMDLAVNNIKGCNYTSDKTTSVYRNFVSVSNDEEGKIASSELIRNNKVTIDGTAIAGMVHRIDMTIGDPGDFVILDESARTAYNKTNSGTSAIAQPTITYGENSDQVAGIKYETVNVSFDLYNDYLKAQEVLAQYSNNKTSEAYAVAYAKVQAFETQMEKLGLVEYDASTGQPKRDADNRVIVTQSLRTDAVVLPELNVSGGDITINTENLVSSSGTMQANGAPEVSITNNTNLYLVLDNITVGEAGGDIIYTNISGAKTKLDDASAQGTAAKNQLIASKNTTEKNVSFTAIYTDASEEIGEIEITGAYAGAKTYNVNPSYGDPAAADQLYTYRVLADIELASGKSIVHKNGNVTISSANNDLFINGSVNGKNITLEAANGSLFQNGTASSVMIGGDVQQLYSETVNSYVNNDSSISWTADGKNRWIGSVSSDAAVGTDDRAGSIMGENIFITAEAINVNGLVQSGYESYGLKLTDTDTQKMAALDAKYGTAAYSDDNIIALGKKSDFCIRQGGNVWNEAKGYYDYEITVYYNPSTKKILVPNVGNSAGNIYLTGKIYSTGNGRIVAMDGTYNIDIDSRISNNDLKLYGLITSTVEGKVTINDLQTHTQTVISRSGSTVLDLDTTTGHIDKTSGRVVQNADGSYTYKPDENLVYSWTLGKDSSTRSFYERKYEENLWGLRTSKDVTSDIGKATKTSEIYLDAANKDSANNVKQAASALGHNLVVSAEKKQVSGATSDAKVTRWETGLWGYRKHTLYEWYVDSGDSYAYTASVNASQAINIKLIGNASNISNVNVAAGGSVDVHGDIGNSNSIYNNNITSNVNITSNNGGIFQDRGQIMGNNVVLAAKGSMTGVNIETSNGLNLTATNTAVANTTYYRNGQGTIVSDGNEIIIKANLNGSDALLTLKGVNGNASDNTLAGQFNLTTNASIMQEADASAISAAKITLNSTNGSIGSFNRAILVSTPDTPVLSTDSLSASVNASADGNIYITEESGSFRVGTIYSEKGNVVLAGPGSLVDALPYVVQDDGRSEQELIAHWKSLGVLDEQTYVGTTITPNDKPLYQYVEDDTLDANAAGVIVRTDADGTVHKYLQRALTDEHGNQLYQGTEQTAAAWDYRKLLYAISDEIINPTSGIDPSKKVTNIKAKNITLHMGDSAGLNSDTVTEYQISKLGTGAYGSDLADLKLLAKSDASSVTWDEINDKVTIRQKLPIGVYLTDANGKVSVGGYNGAAAVTGNIYLETRSENADKTVAQAIDLYLGGVNAAGNVLLKNAFGGIYAAGGLTGAAITAGALDIEAGGKGSANGYIGLANSLLPVNISGTLKAIGTGGVYINQIGTETLKVANISSTGDIYLRALNDIISDNTLNERSYLRLEKDNTTATLESVNGSVGQANNYFRVLNDVETAEDEAVERTKRLIVKAGNSAYIEGCSTDTRAQNPAPQGTLYVDNITVGTKRATDASINIRDNGNICIIDASAPIINLDAKARIYDAPNSKLATALLNAQAVNGITLDSTANDLQQVKLYNSGMGDVTIVNGGSHDLIIADFNTKVNAAAGEKVDGSLNVLAKNGGIVNNANVNVSGNVKLEADNTIFNSGELVARNSITIQSNKGSVYNFNNISSTHGNAAIYAAALLYSGSSEEHEVRGDIINILGTIRADGDITLGTYNGNIINVGFIEANTGSIELMAKQDCQYKFKENYTAAADKEIYVGNKKGYLGNVLNIDSVSTSNTEATYGMLAQNGITITAAYDVNNSTNMKITGEAGNITITSGSRAAGFTEKKRAISNTGSIYNSGSAQTTAGNLQLTANDDLVNTGSMQVAGSGNIAIESVDGSIYNADSGAMNTANGNITMKADSSDVNSYIMPYGTASIQQVTEAQLGNKHAGTAVIIDNRMYVVSKDDSRKYYDTNGELQSIPAGASKMSVNLITIDNKPYILYTNGSIINKGSATAQSIGSAGNGMVQLNSLYANVSNEGNIIAGSYIDIDAGKNIDNEGYLTSEDSYVNLDAKGKIYNSLDIKAASYVEVIAGNDIVNVGDLTSEKSYVDLDADGNVENFGDMQAASYVEVTAGNNIKNEGYFTSSGSYVNMEAGNHIFNQGNIHARTNVNMIAKGEDGPTSDIYPYAIINYGVITDDLNTSTDTYIRMTATKGSVYNKNVIEGTYVNLTAQQDVINRPAETVPEFYIYALSGLDIEAKQGSISNYAEIKSDGQTTMTAGNQIYNAEDSNINSYGYINMTAENKVINYGGLTSRNDITIISKNNGVYNYNMLQSQFATVALYAAEDLEGANADNHTVLGNIVNTGSIKAGNNVYIKTENGNIENKNAITAVEGWVHLTAKQSSSYVAKQETSIGNITNSHVRTANTQEDSYGIKAAQGINIEAAYDVNNGSNMKITGTEGNIVVKAGDNTLGFDGKKRSITETGKIINSGDFYIGENTTGKLDLDANDDIFNTGRMTVDGVGNVELTSAEGSVYNFKDADIIAANGNILMQVNSSDAGRYYYAYGNSSTVKATDEQINSKYTGQAVIYKNAIYATGIVEGVLKYYDSDGTPKPVPADVTAYINVDMINVTVNDNDIPAILFNNGDIINNGDALAINRDSTSNANGMIQLYSAHGSVYNMDYFNTVTDSRRLQSTGSDSSKYNGITISTGDVYILAPEGYVYNDKDLDSENNVYVVAKKGLDNFSYNIQAEKNVMLIGTGGTAQTITIGNKQITFDATDVEDADVVNKARILSNSGNVLLKSYNGSVSNLDGGDIAAFKGNVTIEAGQLSAQDSNIIQFIANDGTRGYLADNGKIVYDKKQAVQVDSYIRSRESNGDGSYKTIVKFVVNGVEKTIDFDHLLKDSSENYIKLGDVAVFREGSVANYGDLIAGSYTVKDGNIDMSTRNSGTITLKSETADVYNYDNFNKVRTGISDVEVEELYKFNDKNSYALAAGSIVMSAENGELYTEKKTLVAFDDVSLTAREGLKSLGFNINAGGNITLHTTAKAANSSSDDNDDFKSSIFNTAKLTSAKGDIIIISDAGSIVNALDADIAALNGNVILQATGKGDNTKVYQVDADGNITACTLNFGGIDTTSPLITDKYYKDSENNAHLIDQSVNISILTADEKATVYTVVNYIDGDGIKKEIGIINKNVELFHVGDVVNRGDIVARGTAKANESSKGTIQLISGHANVTNYDNFSMSDGFTYYKAVDGEWNTQLNSAKLPWKAGEAYTIGEETDIVIGEKKQFKASNDIALEAYQGYIYNDFNIFTDSSLKVVSGKNLTIGSNFNVLEVGKDLFVQSIGIRDKNNPDQLVGDEGKVIDRSSLTNCVKGNITFDGAAGVKSTGELKSLNGSIVLSSKYGDVNAESVKAGTEGDNTHLAALGSGYGNVYVGTITGDDVILYNKVMSGKLVVKDKLNVKQNLVIQGGAIGSAIDASGKITESKININNTGTKGLHIDINGADGKAIGGTVAFDVKGNTFYSTLAVTDAEINVIGGTLAIENLHVTGKAQLNALGYNTSVYGTTKAPYKDASAAIYYDAGKGEAKHNYNFDELFNLTNIPNDPKSGEKMDVYKYYAKRVDEMGNYISAADKQMTDVTAFPSTWHTSNSKWMNLFIDTPNYQRSNGLLLHLKNYYYVGDQRYPLDNQAAIEVAVRPADVYELNFVPRVTIYDKYDLVGEPIMPISNENGFFITNANGILGNALLSEKDLLGLEKAVLGPVKAEKVEAYKVEEDEEK